MRWMFAEGGQIRTVGALKDSLCADGRAEGKSFVCGLEALDELLPGGAWARGAVHEFLGEDGISPAFAALVVARAALRRGGAADRIVFAGREAGGQTARAGRVDDEQAAALVWCDRSRRFYPPAAAALGVRVERLFLLRAPAERDELWAIGQCLRCPGVGATVAGVGRLTQLQARRLQLAAEEGGGIGVLLRPAGTPSRIYAAATRWLVSRAAGDTAVQRWRLQLTHGHGGRVGQSVYLEHSRDIGDIKTNPVRAVAELAHRPDAAGAEQERKKRVA